MSSKYTHKEKMKAKNNFSDSRPALPLQYTVGIILPLAQVDLSALCQTDTIMCSLKRTTLFNSE